MNRPISWRRLPAGAALVTTLSAASGFARSALAQAGRLSQYVITGCAAVGLLCLGGCSYLEAVHASTPAPDTRVRLGRQDAVSLTARELPNYTCDPSYLLTCERGGSVTYECTCVLR